MFLTESFDAHRNEIILSCNVHGRPNVTWLRDDHTISNNRYKLIEEPGGVHKLIIRNPISSDCGVFTCLAENEERIDAISKSLKIAKLKQLMASAAITTEENGNTQTNSLSRSQRNAQSEILNENDIQYKISQRRLLGTVHRDKPIFNSLLHDRTVTEGSNVRLVCNVLADEQNTKIEWLHNHEPISKDPSKYLISYQGGIASLEICSATEQDSGNYTCLASNDYGETFTNAHLRIYKNFDDASQPSVFTQSIRGSIFIYNKGFRVILNI